MGQSLECSQPIRLRLASSSSYSGSCSLRHSFTPPPQSLRVARGSFGASPKQSLRKSPRSRGHDRQHARRVRYPEMPSCQRIACIAEKQLARWQERCFKGFKCQSPFIPALLLLSPVMLTVFRPRLFKARFVLPGRRKCPTVAIFLPCTLRVVSNLPFAACLFVGTLTLLPLSTRGQITETDTTVTSGTEPPLPAGEISRPSQEVQVEANANPVNENFRRFRYSVGVTVREVYDDNINISSSNRVSDSFTVIETVRRFVARAVD